MTNKLKEEKSPYLKQHKDNPVNWLAWNKESLEQAKKEKKPIFLSVGYASCHWCHVMAHESFEDDETAKIMNEKFINIKVDREERPDLDYVFQRSLSILTGTQGGWPLSMFLDENGVPFTGGTYFPPKEMHGRPDFQKVLNNVSDVYNKNRQKILDQAPQMQEIFGKINQRSAVLNQPLEPFLEKIIQHLDKDNGSFKGAPKFPQFYLFDAMFYFYLKTGKEEYFKPVETLLHNISSKGMYDHLAGGIARYTVDENWIVPHFEKMLYDNIQYIGLLNKFFQKTNNLYYKGKLEQTINFINSEFKNDFDLYGSAYDADSDGVEGKYYVWNYTELKNTLGSKFNLFAKKYNLTEEGNFEGNNILIETHSKISDDEIKEILIIEKALLDQRNKRAKPLFDDKSQTDQNCFLLETLLLSSLVTDNEELKQNTLVSIKILEKYLSDKIFHCYQDTEIDAFLEDYVYYASLLITIYELDGDVKYIEKAKDILIKTWEYFFDKKSGLMQKNKILDNDLFVQPVDLNDNNIPNGNSVYLNLCNKIYIITSDKIWFEKIDILKKSFHQVLNSNFAQMFSFVKSLDICNESISFTIHGKQNLDPNIKKYLQKKFFTRATFIYLDNEVKEAKIVICKNQTCSNKLSNIKEIEDYLKRNNIS